MAGRGSRPAASAMGRTASSHSMAMMWTPATPSISRISWICSMQILIPSAFHAALRSGLVFGIDVQQPRRPCDR